MEAYLACLTCGGSGAYTVYYNDEEVLEVCDCCAGTGKLRVVLDEEEPPEPLEPEEPEEAYSEDLSEEDLPF